MILTTLDQNRRIPSRYPHVDIINQALQLLLQVLLMALRTLVLPLQLVYIRFRAVKEAFQARFWIGWDHSSKHMYQLLNLISAQPFFHSIQRNSFRFRQSDWTTVLDWFSRMFQFIWSEMCLYWSRRRTFMQAIRTVCMRLGWLEDWLYGMSLLWL